MADETPITNPTPAADPTPAPANGDQPTDDGTGKETPAEKVFTQAELNREIEQRLQRERVKSQEAAQKAAKEAEAKTLAEQGEFKTLYEKLKADHEAAQQRVKAMELDALRSKVGRAVGLPDALHGRLTGEDEETLAADAKALLAALPKPAAPNINAQAGAQPASDAAATAAAAQELAAIYGVNAKFWPTQKQ